MMSAKEKEKWRSIFEKLKPYADFLRSGKRGMLVVVTLFSSWLMSGMVKAYFSPVPVVVCYLVALILVFLVSELCFWLTRLLFQNRKRSIIYGFVAFTLCFTGGMLAAQGQNILSNMLFGILVVLGLDLFGRSLFSIVKEKRREKSGFVTLFLSGICICGAAVFLFAEGGGENRIAVYRQSAENDVVDLKAFQAQTKEGKFEVSEVTYGVEASYDIPSTKVDLSALAERSVLTGACMQWYFGYDLDESPIAGKMWYPKDRKNCPVLFIVHGNHDYTTPSYLGYDYLGEYLASFGYFVVSVDENICNDLVDENDARAVLLLENIKQILSWNEDADHELYQKIDKEKIAIAGHSRGGEIVATAYYFNQLTNYPDDGKITFDYHFPIQSVIAIAPCVDQYMPGERSVTISDVNYLVLHGANDQDVSTAMGEKQYTNVKFSGNGQYMKSMLYILGANHGQFNEQWGKYDLYQPANYFLNVKNFLSEDEQQEIAKIFVKTFLDVTLLEDRTYASLFSNVDFYKNALPFTAYEQVYQDSSFLCLADYEEDADVKSGTMEQVTISTEDMDCWHEGRRVMGSGYDGENYVCDLSWKEGSNPVYILSIPETDMSHQGFSFSIADITENEEDEQTMEKPYVVLGDKNGAQAVADISTVLYPTWKVQLQKLDVLFNQYEYKHHFQTVILSPEEFVAKGEAFDMKHVKEIRILFSGEKAGNIQLDEIGLCGEGSVLNSDFYVKG